jgi:RNA polymerase sigma-70 factor (ECF subfamily)
VEPNRAVAIAMADGPAAGLARLEAIAGDERLAGYPTSRGSRGPAPAGRPARRRRHRRALQLTSNESSAFSPAVWLNEGGAPD